MELNVKREESRIRREQILNAMKAPDANVIDVARQFGLSVGHVYHICSDESGRAGVTRKEKWTKRLRYFVRRWR